MGVFGDNFADSQSKLLQTNHNMWPYVLTVSNGPFPTHCFKSLTTLFSANQIDVVSKHILKKKKLGTPHIELAFHRDDIHVHLYFFCIVFFLLKCLYCVLYSQFRVQGRINEWNRMFVISLLSVEHSKAIVFTWKHSKQTCAKFMHTQLAKRKT